MAYEEIKNFATSLMNEEEIKNELLSTLQKTMSQQYYLSLNTIVEVLKEIFTEEEIKTIKEKL
jgi:uncharacterized Fe-S cluster-containing MiaB family protein